MKQHVCRFCGTQLLHTFADLGMSPVSNAYIKPENSNAMEPFYPLHARVCAQCFLVQVEDFESREQLFNPEYAYFSSYSDSWLQHSKNYVEMISKRFDLNATSQVVELASNDGYLLQYFVAQGVPALGIEPTANTAEVAVAKGIPTIVKFFGVQTAHELVAEGYRADLLLGNNVLAHVPDINDFVGGMPILLKPTGVITMEFPHLLRLMDENQFDTIYHEHYSYLSFTTVGRIFAKHGLTLFDVDELPTHGGSLRIYARHTSDTSKPISERAQELLAREEARGLSRIETYVTFGEQVKRTKRALLKLLIELKEQGKTIAGYGAPAKGNTLLNYCGIRSDMIDYTVDRNTVKQGMLLPGIHIPIYAPEQITETKPDYVLILPWNIRDEILTQMAHIRSWGGQFIVPIPEARILP
jgi:2-polyprenyl-3-methyl-5-hydroxy-6-metoxy-1,4-benzoquinol methylase